MQHKHSFVSHRERGKDAAMAHVELEQIGDYSITRLLSTDSSRSIYLGRQPRRKKEVLIQLLHAPLATAEAREAFITYAQQLRRLKHRTIIEMQKVDIFQDAGGRDCGYLVMEYINGETLRQYIPPGSRLAPDEVKRIITPIADALQYAHTLGIVHGNLHPGNIIKSARGEFFLANFALPLPTINPDEDTSALPYTAPEVLRGAQPTAASDQYALAAIAYEWLCGQPPYVATDRETLLRQQEQAAIAAPRSLNEAISEGVERVLLQALARNLEERFPGVFNFSNAYLRTLMGLPVEEAQHPGTSQRPRPVFSLSTSPQNNHYENREAQAVSPLDESNSKEATLQLTTPDSGPKKTGKVSKIIPFPVKSQSQRYSSLHEIVTADLEQGGELSKNLPGYEERPAQIEMATLVALSLTDDIPALCEAGTGTGKSLAYLLPIVRSGKVAIISTANKALQEQLFYKDIPFVQQHIQPFEAALVKGMGNYVCLDRLEEERHGMQFYAKNPDFMRLVNLTEDPDAHFNGDFETLGFPLPGDIRSRVFADGDQCAWSKCGYFADCYVNKMRTKAKQAQVIVVNHTLLLLDAALEGFLLPERDVIVIDEAHHLEEEACRAFTVTISPAQVNSLLSQRLLKEHSEQNLQYEVNKAMNETWERLRFIPDLHFKGRVNLLEPMEEGLHLASAIAKLGDSLRRERPKDMPEKESTLYDKLLKRAQNLADNVRLVFSVERTDKFVYYVERENSSGSRNNYQFQVSAAPLDVTEWLRERLFDKCNIICTSATLATIGASRSSSDSGGSSTEGKGPNFSYFRRRVGLDHAHYPQVLERILPLAFDYESNALLYIPRHLPEPAYGENRAADEYTTAIAREMYKLVKCSRGRAFLLFSSKRMLDRAFDLMAPHLDYPLLRQGDMTRIELTRRFREEEGAVLFGLKSFWEGVDIAGDALSLVVIDKLPFEPPDDPVHEARVAQMKAAGENWFGSYVLPQAVLRLKQGLGRLLRTRDDRGVMAILDTRLHTKGYGKQVLNALPPARRTSSIRDVEQFFA